jgi:hypothetical protein
MSSFLNAANKKIRRREKTRSDRSDVPEIEAEPSSYNERNIDREIELRRVKEQLPAPQQQQAPPTLHVSSSRIESVHISSSSVSEVTSLKHYPAYPATADFYSYSSSEKMASEAQVQLQQRLEGERQELRLREEQQRIAEHRVRLAKQQVELEMARTRREMQEDEDAVSIASSGHSVVVKSPMGRHYLTSATLPQHSPRQPPTPVLLERSRRGSLDSLLESYSEDSSPSREKRPRRRRHRSDQRRHTLGAVHDLQSLVGREQVCGSPQAHHHTPFSPANFSFESSI